MGESSEPRGLSARLPLTREAARAVWGDAAVADALARVDPETRSLLTGAAPLPEWIPERVFIAWTRALWEGPAESHDREGIARWSAIVTERGFAAARELFLSLGGPAPVMRRANELWHYEHTHGKLTFAPLDVAGGRLTLSEHPFVDHEPTCIGIAEAFRRTIELCGSPKATASFERTDDALHVTLAWTPLD